MTADDTVDIIAHRGFAGLYPENTVGAVRRATSGEHHPVPDMVEIDVQPCKEGDIIVFHDDDLRKRGGRGLTDVSGTPWETPCEEVRQAEVLASGETVPTLDEVLAAVPAGVGVNIEFKDVASDRIRFQLGSDAAVGKKLEESRLKERKEIWADFVAAVLDTAADYQNDILISSFFEGALAAARDVDAGVPAAFLLWPSISDGLAVAERYDCDAVHPPIDMVAGSPFFNENVHVPFRFDDIDIVTEAHAAGRAVNAWTVETWFQADQMVQAGVDGIFADYPLLTAYRE